jgi:8-oxo-dGTP pyrophosphatase MutT (NUDIX family)
MRRIAVRAIITDGDKLLLVKLISNGKPLDFYCTVGGGLDESEGLIEGLKREVLEETGVVAEVGKLLCIMQFTDKHDNIEFFFHVTNTEDFKNIDLSKTSHGEEEIAEIGFYSPSEVTVLPEFLKEISVDDLINSEEVKFYNYL